MLCAPRRITRSRIASCADPLSVDSSSAICGTRSSINPARRSEQRQASLRPERGPGGERAARGVDRERDLVRPARRDPREQRAIDRRAIVEPLGRGDAAAVDVVVGRDGDAGHHRCGRSRRPSGVLQEALDKRGRRGLVGQHVGERGHPDTSPTGRSARTARRASRGRIRSGPRPAGTGGCGRGRRVLRAW